MVFCLIIRDFLFTFSTSFLSTWLMNEVFLLLFFRTWRKKFSWLRFFINYFIFINYTSCWKLFQLFCLETKKRRRREKENISSPVRHSAYLEMKIKIVYNCCVSFSSFVLLLRFLTTQQIFYGASKGTEGKRMEWGVISNECQCLKKEEKLEGFLGRILRTISNFLLWSVWCRNYGFCSFNFNEEKKCGENVR